MATTRMIDTQLSIRKIQITLMPSHQEVTDFIQNEPKLKPVHGNPEFLQKLLWIIARTSIQKRALPQHQFVYAPLVKIDINASTKMIRKTNKQLREAYNSLQTITSSPDLVPALSQIERLIETLEGLFPTSPLTPPKRGPKKRLHAESFQEALCRRFCHLLGNHNIKPTGGQNGTLEAVYRVALHVLRDYLAASTPRGDIGRIFGKVLKTYPKMVVNDSFDDEHNW